jgi:drug/metabolite transporter (DMT)-like permease
MPSLFVRFAPMLALIGASFIWASSFVVMKVMVGDMPPMLMMGLRMLAAALCLLPFLKLLRQADYRRGDWKLLGLLLLCEPCLYFLCEANALRYTSASQAGMIVAMLPLMVAASARFTLGEAVSRSALAGLLLAVAGVVGLSLGSVADEHASNPVLGNFLEFLAMVCATGYAVAGRKLLERYSPLCVTALQGLAGCVFYLPMLLLPGVWKPEALTPMALLGLFFLGCVVSLGALGLYNYGNSKMPAAKAAAYLNLLPVFALLLGVAILDEGLTGPQTLSAGLVFAGVFMSSRR